MVIFFCLIIIIELKRANMGIDGLLKFLAPITQKQHISSFKNQRIGIDLMPWIYRGCYSCNFELSQNIESFRFLYYPLEMIEILSFYNIKPIFVLDGRSISMKDETNEKRRKEKQQNKQKGLKFLKEGKMQEARKYLSRCIFLDEKILSTTVNVLFSKNIDFIVAPYEADCQIAQLKKLNLIDAAISEDSDLLVYGINTILKLNQNGDCDYIDMKKWRPRDVDSKFLKQFLSMDQIKRVDAAILAGTDYNTSIKGIGIKRAVRNIYEKQTIKEVIEKLKNEPTYADKIPENYLQLTSKVRMIFLFATVYNPIEKTLEYLNSGLLDQYKPQQLTLESLNQIVGTPYQQYFSQQVYKGQTEAKTLKPRQIKAIHIRELFNINKENMILQQSFNKKRKQENEAVQRQKDEQKGQNENEQALKPEPKPKKNQELTEEEKEKKKQERKNRIFKLQEVMNSVVEMCNEEERDQEQIKTKKLQKEIESLNKTALTLKQMMNQKLESKPMIQQEQRSQQEKDSSISDHEIQEESQSLDIDLGHLNPFIKRNQATNTKEESPKSITK